MDHRGASLAVMRPRRGMSRCRTQRPSALCRLSALMALPTVSEWLPQLRTLHPALQQIQEKGEPFLQEAK